MTTAETNSAIDPGSLGSILRYDPDTGKLFWLPRTPDMFQDGRHTAAHSCAKWNARYAGQEALTNIHTEGYRRGRIYGRPYSAHRAAFALMTGRWPESEIDHINGVRADNRWANLREATSSQNKCNRHGGEGATSVYRGVHWARREEKWAACIQVRGSVIHIGYFQDEHQAAVAYDERAKILHGAFATLNFARAG